MADGTEQIPAEPVLGPMARAIADKVKSLDWVTFIELERIPGFKAAGDPAFAYLVKDLENVVMWVDMTKEGIEGLREALGAGAIHIKPANLLSYIVDGGRLDLPLAKRARDYKTEHWYPVCFRPGPMPEKEAAHHKRTLERHRAKRARNDASMPT